jgi:tRNA (mo5U34)-methyltransferase
MDSGALRQEIARFPYWYHRIELIPGVVTPGFHLEPLWNHLRSVRNKVEYSDKVVLDIASFDGMFAFEAEEKKARTVVATDCLYNSFANFMFCREILKSRVVPYYNISPYNLTDRLDVYFDEQFPPADIDRRFDIVQHFGLLYHLRDPLLSLSQARSVLTRSCCSMAFRTSRGCATTIASGGRQPERALSRCWKARCLR